MGIISRAVRNISRRKIRALLVIIALSFSIALMVSIPAGALANEHTTSAMASSLSNTITSTSESINSTLSQIDCSLSSSYAGYGFSAPNITIGQTGPGGTPSGSSGFDPSQFGGGGTAGQFGGGSLSGGEASPMNETLYTDINSTISGVAAVEPILEASEGSNTTISINGRSFTTQVTNYTIEGLPLTSDLIDNYNILTTNITAGRNLEAGDSGVVLLSENNSAYFGAGVGDTVTILNQTFTVVGIHGTSSASDRLTLYMNLSDAQSVTNNTGYITSFTVFTTSSDVVDSVASTISTLHSELTVTTGSERLSQLESLQSTYASALTSAQNSVSQTQTTAIEEIVVVVAATSLIVLFVMLYTVRERTKEIGTLKAIGLSNMTVMGQFMLEGVLLSMIAGVVGIAIASFAAPTISSLLLPSVGSTLGLSVTTSSATTSVSLSSEIILLGFGAAMLLGVLGSLYPAWRAAKIRPAEAMRYE